MAVAPGAVPSWPVRVVADGQSLVYHPYTDGATSSFWRQLGYLLDVPVGHVAVGGMGWLNLLNGLEGSCDPAVERWATILQPSSARNGLVMFGGQGDLGGNSGATIYDRACDYADAARVGTTVNGETVAFDFVVCLTIPEVSVALWGGPYEPQRTDFNDLLRANAEDKFDGVVDLDGFLTDPTDATYYLDGLHLNARGSRRCAEEAEPVVSPLLTP